MKIILLLMYLSIVPLKDSSERDFYKSVLDSFHNHSAYILLDVESKEYKDRVIIENTELFVFLSKTKGFDKNKYKEYMLDLLSKKNKLELRKSDLEKTSFFKLKEVEEVEKIASKGKEYFLNHYFVNDVLMQDIGDYERSAIIAKLFEWKIAAMIDDYSARLIIVRMKTDEPKNFDKVTQFRNNMSMIRTLYSF